MCGKSKPMHLCLHESTKLIYKLVKSIVLMKCSIVQRILLNLTNSQYMYVYVYIHICMTIKYDYKIILILL